MVELKILLEKEWYVVGKIVKWCLWIMWIIKEFLIFWDDILWVLFILFFVWRIEELFLMFFILEDIDGNDNIMNDLEEKDL